MPLPLRLPLRLAIVNLRDHSDRTEGGTRQDHEITAQTRRIHVLPIMLARFGARPYLG